MSMLPLKLVPDNTNIPFLKYRVPAMGFSILLILASIALVVTQGFNLGVDFVGGQQVRVDFAQPVQIDDLREEAAKFGLGEPTIQHVGGSGSNAFTLRFPLPEGGDQASADAATKIRAEIAKNHSGASIGAVETVSGKVSDELFRAGALALTLAMVAIALFIWFRFEWQFGVGALFALFHDVMLTLGFFALTQLEFDLNVVSAILTIIGYSLNDTIVVYDRIRENMKKYRNMDMEGLLDLSVNETLSRTMVTSLSLIIALTILLILGPDVLFGFTASMLLGIGIGTFSSVYVSAAILLWLKLSPDSFVTKKDVGPSGAERVAPADDGAKP